jgi:hypothetical protein
MGVFQLKTVANFNEHLLLLTTFRLGGTYFWYTFRLVSDSLKVAFSPAVVGSKVVIPPLSGCFFIWLG